MQTQGLSERRGLQMVHMSASALRYQPRPDRNRELRARIVALAQRHRRYGVGMIHLKLRQAGSSSTTSGSSGYTGSRSCISGAGGARRFLCQIGSHWYALLERARSNQRGLRI